MAKLKTHTGLDTDVAARVLHDCARGHKPDKSYTPEMRDFHAKASAEHANHRADTGRHGDSVSVPDDLPAADKARIKYSDED